MDIFNGIDNFVEDNRNDSKVLNNSNNLSFSLGSTSKAVCMGFVDLKCDWYADKNSVKLVKDVFITQHRTK